jgi:TatD DNase family protein
MLIDAHAHIDRYDLIGEEPLETALNEIDQHRIFTLSNSMDIPSYERNLEISKRNPLILPIFGVHPWNASAYADRLEDLQAPIAHSPLLGEIGLDHHFIQDQSEYPLQKRIFQYFLAAAQDQGKIVCLHTKGAEEAVLENLEPYQLPGVLVHWYSGPADIFSEFVAKDCYFTFGVEIVYANQIQELAKQAPLDRLLTETDNPGGPKSLIGHPGMPSLIKDVIQRLAQMRDRSPEEMIEIVQSNLQALFRRDSRLSAILTHLQEGG